MKQLSSGILHYQHTESGFFGWTFGAEPHGLAEQTDSGMLFRRFSQFRCRWSTELWGCRQQVFWDALSGSFPCLTPGAHEHC
jgi:hypothetical protein